MRYALVVFAVLFGLQGCKTVAPKPAEPVPLEINWYRAGCKVVGVVSFEGTDKVLTIQAPVSACGRGV